MEKLKATVIIIILMLVLILIMQNAQPVVFRFLLWYLMVPRFLIVPLLVFLGFVLGYLTAKIKKKKKQSK